MKELQPELVATHQGDARVLEGHAFVVEAAVSVGGRDIKPGINVYRFANRIPLLFEVRARARGRCPASCCMACTDQGSCQGLEPRVEEARTIRAPCCFLPIKICSGLPGRLLRWS